MAGLGGRELRRVSRGQAQLVALARCLLADPALLLLDEPARGLAPHERHELGQLLRKLAAQGKAAVVSARLLTELETACTHLAVLEEGQLKAFGPADAVYDRISRESRLQLAMGDRYRCDAGRQRPLVEVWELHKWYGRQHAVDDLTFELEPGQILGFIGPNGAGKTTTLRMLAGLLEPSDGNIFVDGRSVPDEPREARRFTGYMPDEFGVYENISVAEYLEFFAESFGFQRHERRRLLADVLDLTELAELRDRDVQTLSRGQSQRVSLARCLMHDPKLLLLDEPASGLDPRARIELRELLKELSAMGKAILISSHILTELEEFCTHLAVINRGKILSWGPRDKVFAQFHQEGTFRATLVGRAPEAAEALRGFDGVLEAGAVGEREVVGRFSAAPDEAAEIVSFLVQHGFGVMGFTQEQLSLERLFLEMTERQEAGQK